MSQLQLAILAIIRLRSSLRRADGSADLLRAPAIEALEALSPRYALPGLLRRRLWMGEVPIAILNDALDALGQHLLDEELVYEIEPADSTRGTDPPSDEFEVTAPYGVLQSRAGAAPGEEALGWYGSLDSYGSYPGDP